MAEKPSTTSNSFHILEEEGEEKSREKKGPTSAQETEIKGSEEENNTGNMPVIMEEDDAEDMELGDLDLDTLEEECRNVGKGYVSREQIELL